MSTCSICAGQHHTHFVRQDGYDYVACDNCGFVFLDPMPDPDRLHQIYNEDEGAISVGSYPKARSRMRRAMLRALRLLPYYFRREAIDVGCGGGFVVEAMRRLGARSASGLDISAPAIAFARSSFPKATFYEETFGPFLARGLQFDFLHSSEVIEHIGAVHEYMNFLSAIARPGARLFITTPDIGHPTVPQPVTSWDMLSPPRHVHFFTEKTLETLFDAHGFDIVRRDYKKDAPTLQVLARKR
jgi:2-polyprenyl-3-methyl-5-hydroxy-6-metoxy-1,4-benzoquinol methylase